MSDLVIGIDPGGRKFDLFAIASMGDEAITVVHSYEAKKSSVGRECDEIARHAQEVIDQLANTYGLTPVIFIEAPVVAGAGNLQVSLRIAQTVGALHTVTYDSYQVAVAEWKKTVIGKGNAGKPEVKEWMQVQYPNLTKLCTKQDHFDAAAIALFGREKMGIARRVAEPTDSTGGGREVPEHQEPVA